MPGIYNILRAFDLQGACIVYNLQNAKKSIGYHHQTVCELSCKHTYETRDSKDLCSHTRWASMDCHPFCLQMLQAPVLTKKCTCTLHRQQCSTQAIFHSAIVHFLLESQPAGCKARSLDHAKLNCISQNIICLLMRFSAAVHDV